MAITMRDIAKKVGVSVTAVSKALNGQTDVSEELRDRVLKVAEELDYSANTIARRLVTNRSKTIGVFTFSRNSLRENFQFEYIAGIMEEANKNEYDIVLFSTDSDLIDKKSYVKLCKERRVEAAIISGLRLDDPHIQELEQSDFPVIIRDTTLNGENVYSLSVDNQQGVKQALTYLWDSGHRNILFLNGHINAQVSRQRFNAYEEFTKVKNKFNDSYVFEGDYTKESGYHAGIEIVELIKELNKTNKSTPTALFAASDLMAIGAIEAFKEKGLSLPQDMSVVGFDNIVLGEYVEPHLTTIGQNSFSLGRDSVKMVLDKLRGKKIHSKKIEPELVVRDSVIRI